MTYNEDGDIIDPCDQCGEPMDGSIFDLPGGEEVCEDCYNLFLDELES